MSHRFINLDNCEQIGHIGVDSGQMMLLDPCYVDSIWDKADDLPVSIDMEPTETVDYNGACSATLSVKKSGILGRGIAAVCATGFGDGQYPVYVEFSDEGEWGRRVKSMTIVFIDDSEQDDEDLCEDCGVSERTVEWLCDACHDARDEEG